MTFPLESVGCRELGALRLVREDSFFAPWNYPSEKFLCASPRLVFEFMEPYAKREEAEVFWILALDAQHRVIRNRPITVTRGILNSVLVHPREIFRLAIHANAACVILVHNHPSGDPTPSADDRAITAQLVAAGRLLDLPVVDHVVIGRGRYLSCAEGGLL
jgi:DNA repair protein RadC